MRVSTQHALALEMCTRVSIHARKHATLNVIMRAYIIHVHIDPYTYTDAHATHSECARIYAHARTHTPTCLTYWSYERGCPHTHACMRTHTHTYPAYTRYVHAYAHVHVHTRTLHAMFTITQAQTRLRTDKHASRTDCIFSEPIVPGVTTGVGAFRGLTRTSYVRVPVEPSYGSVSFKVELLEFGLDPI